MLRIHKSDAGPCSPATRTQRAARVVNPQHQLFTMQDSRDITSSCSSTRVRYIEGPARRRPRIPRRSRTHRRDLQPGRRATSASRDTRRTAHGLDLLTLTVETNGTISPEEAVSYAAALAQTHFSISRRSLALVAPFGGGGDGSNATRSGSCRSSRRPSMRWSSRCARSTRSRTPIFSR